MVRKAVDHIREEEEESRQQYLIIGLGNPGREYRDNRHNIGFMVVDQLSQELDIRMSRMRSKALIGRGKYKNKKIILAKPQTYMNLSGRAVSSLIAFYQISLEQLLVIYDDLDLPIGTLRIRPTGGSAGQKGLASIIQQLGTQDFPRLRVGIGRPPGQMDASKYVLQKFSLKEEADLRSVLELVTDAVKSFIEAGLDQTMNRYNSIVKGE